MANFDSDNHQLLVLDLDENAIVADTVAPGARKVRRKTFAARPRIFELAHFLEVLLDAAQLGAIDLTSGLLELRRDLQAPAPQTSSSSHRSPAGREGLPAAAHAKYAFRSAESS